MTADREVPAAPAEWASATWPEVEALAREPFVAFLPVGSTEAHGPHLAVSADTVIATEMAKRGAAKLKEHNVNSLILPPVYFTVADFGSDGILSFRSVDSGTTFSPSGFPVDEPPEEISEPLPLTVRDRPAIDTAWTSITTSPGPAWGAGTSLSCITSGPPNSSMTIARIV